MTADLSRHAEEVRELWEAFRQKRNRRVPITFACDEQLWLKVSGHRFLEFYRDPRVQLRAQLEGLRWFSENVVGDMPPGLPDRWHVGVREWMSENEFFGCEVVYQENDYAWALPLPLDRDSLLRHIADIDPEEAVRRNAGYRMYQALRELADGMEYSGRPVTVVSPGAGCHGIFTKAAEIRGLARICLDLYDAPDFAAELLRLVTEKTIGRIRAWSRLLTGSDGGYPVPGGFHLCDDSLQMISAEQHERFVLPCHERLMSAMTTGSRAMHLCGRASQHYEVLHRRLGITALDGPGPFVDHGDYLERFGPDFSIAAQTDHSVLACGTDAGIRGMMRRLFTPRARIPGRFQVMGFVLRDTALEKVATCYRAGREYGGMGQ
jgi:hypothetical protein